VISLGSSFVSCFLCGILPSDFFHHCSPPFQPLVHFFSVFPRNGKDSYHFYSLYPPWAISLSSFPFTARGLFLSVEFFWPSTSRENSGVIPPFFWVQTAIPPFLPFPVFNKASLFGIRPSQQISSTLAFMCATLASPLPNYEWDTSDPPPVFVLCHLPILLLFA